MLIALAILIVYIMCAIFSGIIFFKISIPLGIIVAIILYMCTAPLRRMVKSAMKINQ